MATASAPVSTALPTPAQRPDADIVIFDGHCRMCTGQIKRLARMDRGGRLAYVSLHDPLVAERFPDLTYDELMKQMYVVDRRGNRHAGAAAIRYLSRRLPRLWVLMPILHLPFSLPLWNWLYRQVAKRRYKFGKLDCNEGTCSLHR